MSSPNLTAIVAATQSNGIGLNGGLPWRLPGEMKYFAKGKLSRKPLGCRSIDYMDTDHPMLRGLFIRMREETDDR